uniref:Uncharacterized protein n=1 Tax=Setaria italica TaxID=4555 RepID=K3ZMY3_SETIT
MTSRGRRDSARRPRRPRPRRDGDRLGGGEQLGDGVRCGALSLPEPSPCSTVFFGSGGGVAPVGCLGTLERPRGGDVMADVGGPSRRGSDANCQLSTELGNDKAEWVLKHDRDIFPILPNLNYDKQYSDPEDNEAIVEEKMEEKFEWDSDNDNVLEPGSRSKDSYIVFLGFHPYKEVVFLSDKFNRVLAYNWSISKLQDLGKLYPKFYIERDHQFFHRLVSASFPYTPCWLGELPEKRNLEAHQLEN